MYVSVCDRCDRCYYYTTIMQTTETQRSSRGHKHKHNSTQQQNLINKNGRRKCGRYDRGGGGGGGMTLLGYAARDHTPRVSEALTFRLSL